ncbi:unnamed protein product, partial [Allacma fusca]
QCNVHFTQDKPIQIQIGLDAVLAKATVQKCDRCPDEFLSSILLVPKSTGGQLHHQVIKINEGGTQCCPKEE